MMENGKPIDNGEELEPESLRTRKCFYGGWYTRQIKEIKKQIKIHDKRKSPKKFGVHNKHTWCASRLRTWIPIGHIVGIRTYIQKCTSSFDGKTIALM